MIGVRGMLAPVSALLVVLACSGGRETETQRDTTTAAADTSAAAQQPAEKPAPTPAPAPKPAPRPVTKKPAPAPTPVPAETTAAAPAPAETTPAAAPPAETGGGLRDAYHQAPRDTVTPEVYEGWKQFNLNCARCHGEDVLGTTIAPHLIVSVRPGGAVETKEAFVQTVCAGRPEKGMPAWCPLGLEMEKINAIYAYVKGRSEGKIAPGRPARQ